MMILMMILAVLALVDQSGIDVTLNGGTTYYFMVAKSSYFEDGIGVSATLTFNVNVDTATAPSNDTFANATVINSLSYTDTVDFAGATIGNDFVSSCGSASNVPDTGKSIWYTYTPATDDYIRVDTTATYEEMFSVWEVDGLTATEITCSAFCF